MGKTKSRRVRAIAPEKSGFHGVPDGMVSLAKSIVGTLNRGDANKSIAQLKKEGRIPNRKAFAAKFASEAAGRKLYLPRKDGKDTLPTRAEYVTVGMRIYSQMLQEIGKRQHKLKKP